MYNKIKIFYKCSCGGYGYVDVYTYIIVLHDIYLDNVSTLLNFDEDQLRDLKESLIGKNFECKNCGSFFIPYPDKKLISKKKFIEELFE